jgi:hypothetical protein
VECVDCAGKYFDAEALSAMSPMEDRSAKPVPLPEEFNDDLLLSEQDRKWASDTFPTLIDVLDFPQLRDDFRDYDEKANQSKKRLRRAGLATIALGVVALLGASTEPLFPQPSSVVAYIIFGASAFAGFLSIVISAFYVLRSPYKNVWLEARLMTERLRQFQFQILVFHIPTILSCASQPDFASRFGKARDRWYSTFKMEHTEHLSAMLKLVLDDDADEQYQLHVADAPENTPESGPVMDEVFAAYKLLRIKHQMLYANYKLGGDGFDFPRRQVSILSGISLICILFVFFAHFAVSISVVSQWLPQWLLFQTVKDVLTYVLGVPLHVLIIWTVIFALAARTFEEGLQPTREVERYTAYRARLGHLLHHFDGASNLSERILLMTQVEQLIYQEMREFLKTNYKAQFVL